MLYIAGGSDFFAVFLASPFCGAPCPVLRTPPNVCGVGGAVESVDIGARPWMKLATLSSSEKLTRPLRPEGEEGGLSRWALAGRGGTGGGDAGRCFSALFAGETDLGGGECLVSMSSVVLREKWVLLGECDCPRRRLWVLSGEFGGSESIELGFLVGEVDVVWVTALGIELVSWTLLEGRLVAPFLSRRRKSDASS